MYDSSDQTLRRSCLAVPGLDARMVLKALATPADEVIVDLEDSVLPKDKARARAVVAEFLAGNADPRVSVRINALDSAWWADDLHAIFAASNSLSSVVVPKVESARDLQRVEKVISTVDQSPGVVRTRIQALIESSEGLERLAMITESSPRLSSLILGYADLAVSLRRPIGPSASDVWLPVQDMVVRHARRVGIQAIDGPSFDFRDEGSCQVANARAVSLGFDGKWAIHPSQIADLNARFTPASAEVSQAREILRRAREAESAGAGATQLDGRMIDLPVVQSARLLLARAAACETQP